MNAKLRQSLRPAMASAPLTDEKRFVTEMEAAYRCMWQDGCQIPNPLVNAIKKDLGLK